jgi:hypothetical protein
MQFSIAPDLLEASGLASIKGTVAAHAAERSNVPRYARGRHLEYRRK